MLFWLFCQCVSPKRVESFKAWIGWTTDSCLWRLRGYPAREAESLLCEFEMLPLHCLQLAVRVVTCALWSCLWSSIRDFNLSHL
jgi:hypothetical protein